MNATEEAMVENTILAVNKNLDHLTEYQLTIYRQLVDAGHDGDQAAEWVVLYVDPDPAPDKARFAVTDFGSANWVLKQLAQIDAAVQEYEELMASEIQAITDRAQEIIRPLVRKREFFELVYGKQLEDWTAEQIKDQKARSVKLLHGSVGFQQKPSKVILDDESEAAKDALETICPAAIKLVRSVLKTPIKELLESSKRTELHVPASMVTGDGSGPSDDESRLIAHIESGENEFYVKPALPGKGR